MSSVGKLTADFIVIINFGSRESRLQSTQHEPRSHGGVQNKQPTIPPCSASLHTGYRLAYFIWCRPTRNDFEHRHKINSSLFYLFYHVGQVNLMMLALKSGPQIVAKVGNTAGLLCWRIWYSVGKSGVLGITEYRQGRPLYI